MPFLNEAMKVLVDYSLEEGKSALKATKIIADANRIRWNDWWANC